MAQALLELSTFKSVTLDTQAVISNDVGVRDIDGLHALQQLPRGDLPHLAMAMRM